MKNHNNELVAISNKNIDLIDANTIANRLNTTIDNVIHKIQSLGIQPKKYIMKGKRNNVKTALYSWEEFNQQQQQNQLVKIEKKGDKIINNNSMLEIANAFQKSLDNVDSQTIFDSAMALMNIALEKSNKLNQLLEEKNKQLEIELGKSKEYYSIKKVSIMNNKSQKDYKYSLLKRKSIELGLEIKTEQDNNYGKVNSYHINVWKEVYPNEKY